MGLHGSSVYSYLLMERSTANPYFEREISSGTVTMFADLVRWVGVTTSNSVGQLDKLLGKFFSLEFRLNRQAASGDCFCCIDKICLLINSISRRNDLMSRRNTKIPTKSWKKKKNQTPLNLWSLNYLSDKRRYVV